MSNFYNGNNYHGNNKNHNNSKNNPVTVDSNVSYINPYNFISLNKDGCKRYDTNKEKGDLTGYIDCELITKTETIIPDTEHIDSDFPIYSFYNYQEKKNGFIIPVIPGSELRGMLRSDFEVFTDSCLSTIDVDKSFISRTKDVKLPGILKKDAKGDWHLFKAVRYALHTARKGKGFARNRSSNEDAVYMVDEYNRLNCNGKTYKTGDKVRFVGKTKGIMNNVLEISENGDKTGILLIGELGVKKDFKNGKNSIHDSIFVCGDEVRGFTGINDAVKKLKDIIDAYNDKGLNKNLAKRPGWYIGYDVDELEEIPVWHNADPVKNKDPEHRVYLSPAAIGKEAYHRTIDELLDVVNDKTKSYSPCIDKNFLCEACNLFGFVADENAKGSRVRITDAIYEDDENPYSRSRIIKELSSPHAANAAFYSLFLNNADLANMSAVDWNYDFQFIDGKTIPIFPSEITIRGRKMYWHHTPNKDYETNEKTVRNCGIIPVKEGTKFKFKVYFENITKKELQDLIAVINLEYNSDVTYQNKKYYDLYHKIGKAKPFGYGSVKLNVDDVKVRNVKVENKKVSYQMLSVNEVLEKDIEDINLNTCFNNNTQSFKDALRMYNFNYLPVNYEGIRVTYPLGQPAGRDEGGHYWFTYNKNQGFGSPYVLMVLPLVSEGRDIVNNDQGLQTTIKRGNTSVPIDGLKIPKYNK